MPSDQRTRTGREKRGPRATRKRTKLVHGKTEAKKTGGGRSTGEKTTPRRSGGARTAKPSPSAPSSARTGRIRATPARPDDGPRADLPVPVVGVGASAGGLEAFSQLLQALPDAPGLAFVLVQHLAPQHQSNLAQLLGAQSRIPVLQASDGVRLERNHVYVSAPNSQMRLEGDHLRLSARPSDQSQYTPIDYFLRSLAAARGDRAIAVILSGTASDGTLGVREIKAAGGIAIAQRPETARYDGMPRAAIASGFIDVVLSPQEIGPTAVQIGRHPYQGVDRTDGAGRDAKAGQDHERDERSPLLDRVLILLRNGTGVDFRHYKRPTLERRIHRRMILHRLTRLEQFVHLLEDNPAEIQALFDDVLILVTCFFRDPEVFETLAEQAIPRIVEHHRTTATTRRSAPGSPDARLARKPTRSRWPSSSASASARASCRCSCSPPT